MPYVSGVNHSTLRRDRYPRGQWTRVNCLLPDPQYEDAGKESDKGKFEKGRQNGERG
jgi:hypothetical protein